MKRPALALVLGLLAACPEKAPRGGGEAQTPLDSVPAFESTALESTAVPAAPAAPMASPFPADRDTARFKAQVAAGPAAVPACGAPVPRLTGDSIGPFRLGETILDLQRRCPRLLFGWVLISDGYPMPTVAARLGGSTITAMVTDSLPTATLTRVEVTSPGPRTPEGAGVGSTLQELERLYGRAQASESDCALRIWFDALPGLAFLMEYPEAERRECGGLSEPPLAPALSVTAVVLAPK